MENQILIASDQASDTTDLPTALQSDMTEFQRKIDQKREEQGISPEPRDVGIKPLLDRLSKSWANLPDVDAAVEVSAAEKSRLVRNQMLATLVNEAGTETAKCRLDNFRAALPMQSEALRRLKLYAGEAAARIAFGQGLVLFGPRGTGKDHLVFGVCWEALRIRSYKIRWINGQNWFGEIRDGITKDEFEERLMRRMVSPDILVISDVLPPIGSLGQHQATMLYRAINDRRTRDKPTFVTVNVKNDQEAEERMGAVTWDRLCDKAGKIFTNWSSYREPAWKVNC